MRLPLEGFVAVGCEVGVWGSDLFLAAEGERARLRLPDDAASLVEQLAEERAVVTAADADDASTLTVDFGEHGTIHVPAREYEAWELDGPGQLMVVAPAGGGEPAVWDTARKEQR
jgi:hypothetical protein